MIIHSDPGAARWPDHAAEDYERFQQEKDED